jgi:hypothetical protein
MSVSGALPKQPRRAKKIFPWVSRAGMIPLLAALAACGISGTGTSPRSTAPTQRDSEPVFAGKYDVGDCVGTVATRSVKATCGSPDSTEKVVKVVDRNLSDEEARDPSICPGDGSFSLKGVTYCTILDVKPDDCLNSPPEGSHTAAKKIACTTPGAKDRVTKVLPRPEGAELCDEGEQSYSSPNPPQTVCVIAVK